MIDTAKAGLPDRNANLPVESEEEPPSNKDPTSDANAHAHRIHNVKNIIEILTVPLALIATIASIFSAIYSGRQASAAREANAEGQRAFVTFNGLRIDQRNLGSPGLPYIWFTVLTQNSGNTPTKGMRYFVESSRVAPRDPEEIYQHPTGTAYLQRVTLPPHYNGPLALPKSGIPRSSFKAMVQEHGWYYVYGASHYRDRFSGSKEHITKFCFAVGADINDVTLPAYIPCRFWNCIDDDCEAEKLDYEAELRRLNPKASTNKQ